jgi:hypothetical protein
MADLAADTVAQRLRDAPTRAAALDSLERHAAPIPTAVAMCAAPALLELLTMDEREVDRGAFDRAGLLLGRLEEEVLLLPEEVLLKQELHGATFGGGGWEKLYGASSILNAALRKPASELTQADALSYACSRAYESSSLVRGFNVAFNAAGYTTMEFVGVWINVEPIASKKLVPTDDMPRAMLTLTLSLLESDELPDLAISGAWVCMHNCLSGRPSLGPTALERGICEIAAGHLKAIGSPADWASISRGKAGRAYYVLHALNDLAQFFVGQSSRPDLAACVSSGVFDQCITAVAAVAAAGADCLQEMHHGVLYQELGLIRRYRAGPGCDVKIRSIAAALSFWLLHDLDFVQDLGGTTGSAAAQICERQTQLHPLFSLPSTRCKPASKPEPADPVAVST